MQLQDKAVIQVPCMDINNLIVYSFRYCMKRHSYALFDSIRTVKKYWLFLTNGSKECIKRDLREFLDEREHLKETEGILADDYKKLEDLLKWCELQSVNNK